MEESVKDIATPVVAIPVTITVTMTIVTVTVTMTTTQCDDIISGSDCDCAIAGRTLRIV